MNWIKIIQLAFELGPEVLQIVLKILSALSQEEIEKLAVAAQKVMEARK